MKHFLFPADPSDLTCPDEVFAEQYIAYRDVGFSTSLRSATVFSETMLLRNIPIASEVVYRGWMLKEKEYQWLSNAIRKCGAKAFTSLSEYLATHHLPNWYPLLSDLTPETRVYTEDADFGRELRALDWDGYFLKDYVKSLKTARGSIVFEPTEVPAVIADMRDYRGEIEGGICVRQIEEFLPDSEIRYFVLNGVGYSPVAGVPIPNIVQECAKRIPSRFFSVDVAQRRDGVLRVIEVGDGQVSDIVGWSPQAFASMWVKSGCE